VLNLAKTALPWLAQTRDAFCLIFWSTVPTGWRFNQDPVLDQSTRNRLNSFILILARIQRFWAADRDWSLPPGFWSVDEADDRSLSPVVVTRCQSSKLSSLSEAIFALILLWEQMMPIHTLLTRKFACTARTTPGGGSTADNHLKVAQ
jgi:hypothetical protein